MKIAWHSAFALACLAGAQAHGHHSQAAFDHDSVVTLQGTVSRYEWSNPHVYLYLDVGRDGADSAEWQIEADPTPLMLRNGWSADTLVPGDVVLARVHPDNNRQRSHALLISLTTPDGVVLTPRGNGSASSQRAADISGVWDGLRGFTTRQFVLGDLTDKGIAAQTDYDESQNPVSSCRAYATPHLVTLPYLYEIVIEDDRILLRTEFFRVERTIFMDGRGHPANGERSNQGHSVGHWEGDVLVVDTALFTENPVGIRLGLRSGLDKHVVERFSLSEDHTRLINDFVVEDPEYLAQPMTGRMEWDYAPGRELLSFDCDPENARRYAID